MLNEKGGVTLETHRLEGTTMSSDSERTVSVSGSGSVSTDSERTPVRVDSQDSQVSDGEPGDSRWPRQNSVCNANIFLQHYYILNQFGLRIDDFYYSYLCENGTFLMMN